MVVGAGPGGLQAAYFLQQHGLDYLVLEKAEPGNFFQECVIQSNFWVKLSVCVTGLNLLKTLQFENIPTRGRNF